MYYFIFYFLQPEDLVSWKNTGRANKKFLGNGRRKIAEIARDSREPRHEHEIAVNHDYLVVRS